MAARRSDIFACMEQNEGENQISDKTRALSDLDNRNQQPSLFPYGPSLEAHQGAGYRTSSDWGSGSSSLALEDHLCWHLRHPHFHLWTSHKLPHRSTEAHALARAEASSWAQMTPLIAATLGPMAVLLGIPSLTQHWSGHVLNPPGLPDGTPNYTTLPDPSINLILAIITLGCEVLGNVLLIMRFSNFHARATTWGSYVFWIGKVFVGVVNCIQFGISNPEIGNVIYLQGFWVSPVAHDLTSWLVFAVWL